MPKEKVDPEEFKAVALKLKTLGNSEIAKVMGLDRTTIWRFKNKNHDIVTEIETELRNVKTVRFDGEFISKENFRELPIIKEWDELQIIRRVSDTLRGDRINSLFNVCKYLKLPPNKLTPEICAKLVVKMREWEGRHLTDAPLEYRGLSYYIIRKTLRSFFQLVHGVSGEKLTSIGIDAGRSLGTGSMASERVTKEERYEFVKVIPQAVQWVIDNHHLLKGVKSISWDEDEIEIIKKEIEGIAYFMYYTATRFSASHRIKLNDVEHKIESNMWRIHVIDKGKGGGIHWSKRLMDDGIIKMQQYINRRFSIAPNDIKELIPDMDEYLFPWIHANPKHETAIMKRALALVGNDAKQPNHIWRHTFAQDALKATNYNYDLVAEIGGWKNTDTMKLSYGAMDEDAINDGLKLIMGIPIVEREPRFLKW